MTICLDTSAVLRALIGDGDAWGRWARAYSSKLIAPGARRTFCRLRLDRALDDEGVPADSERF